MDSHFEIPDGDDSRSTRELCGCACSVSVRRADESRRSASGSADRAAAALVFGAVLCLLGDIGKRLIRLDEQMTGKTDSGDEAEDLADPEF